MSRDGTRVVKNASILMATQLITWALSLLLVVFLPRYLGAAAVGQFAIAGSIWAIMGMLVGFGVHKNGCSFFTMNTKILGSYSKELKDFKCSGSTVHFDPEKKLPVALIKKIIRQRMKENEERASLKKQSKLKSA
jgi:hypothetical protein